ncbi:adenylate/guanylate cyclase domain-containing protein [Pedococcus sp. 5OH_020]|uniref:adenylate/guanylate cyclase domain-containing protein n=1 Tax=Pedococcus sp. 5OH_020 TaxID=2989814 RepID=UPI0022E9E0E2|nr:adenylate/guanylate cyclase domain-containing protein [Pedococcus sp. 5OH_020]
MAESVGMTPDFVRLMLTGDHPGLADRRRRNLRFPSDPRCKLCAAPFAGVGRLVFGPRGYGRSGNPSLCMKCVEVLRGFGLTGVEIPVSLVFSDVRGSTTLGEQLRPAEFHAFLHHFYKLATQAIVSHGGLVDKIVGDEVIGLFFGGISGPGYNDQAVSAALDLAERAARSDATPSGAIPAGTAVHTGEAFVGASGPADTVDDFTALGDAVNTTARLASAALAGEVIASQAAVSASSATAESRECRLVDIRGRTEPIEVVVLRQATPRVSAAP